MQSYLSDKNFTTNQKQLLFKLRTNMIDVKDNFKGQYLDNECRFGCKEVESQIHLLNCIEIMRVCPLLSDDLSVEYDDIYGNVNKQLNCVKLFDEVLKVRKKLMTKC